MKVVALGALLSWQRRCPCAGVWAWTAGASPLWDTPRIRPALCGD
jgi:hypothetical protein